MEDDQIVDLYWARSERAVAETAHKYGRYCYSIAYNILLNAEDADESVNDTYMDAWNAMPPHRPSILSTFLGKITRNLSIDRYKANHAEKRGGGSLPVALDELSQCISAPAGIETAVEEQDLAQAIDRFLRTLPSRETTMFLRRYWYVDSISDIAIRYNMKENTVKSILFRTREKLRKYLEQEGIAV